MNKFVRDLERKRKWYNPNFFRRQGHPYPHMRWQRWRWMPQEVYIERFLE